VSAVEVKDVDLPVEMKRAMARQAEAERERRAKVIAAEGEFQAADKLAMAASVIAKHPQALQLRYLQTLVEVASENNSTTVFPIPIDLLTPFMEAAKKATGAAGTTEPDAEKTLPASTGTALPSDTRVADRERA
jgi:regulator of protease activity HflC (stomatin/prohibitin superfamily)